MADHRPNVFFLYPNSVERKQTALPGHPSSGKTYLLYGKDLAPVHGIEPLDDFDLCETLETNRRLLRLNYILNRTLETLGAYGGDWTKVWGVRHRLAEADLIFSTTDRVGLPLVLLMAMGLLPKRPVLYSSIGLPERLKLLNPIFRQLYRQALLRCATRIIAYGDQETRELASFLGPARARFIPFGVDTDYFSPDQEASVTGDYILSIGADPHRDYDLLLKVFQNGSVPLRIVASRQRPLPQAARVAHVSVQYDVPFLELRRMIANARFVVLPVRENSYSGATTTLLQCMAMGKAVIVSRTTAIANGYDLKNRENVLWVPPGDGPALSSAIQTLLNDPGLCGQLGARARELVLSRFSYRRFSENLFDLMKEMYA